MVDKPSLDGPPLLDLMVKRTKEGHWTGTFQAMASPCSIILDIADETQARALLQSCYLETKRFEKKFSRYSRDNIVYRLNHANGQPTEVDGETALLLNFADQCFQLSEGYFDITSGVLGTIWRFDGSDNLPTQRQIDQLLRLVGWNRVHWSPPFITMQPDMQIDFGGMGKEYVVDRVGMLIGSTFKGRYLINFGGDIYANSQSNSQSNSNQPLDPWIVGIENPTQLGKQDAETEYIELLKGGIATSGDTRRFLMKDNIRYSHVLNPKTGWPVTNTPRSVTVLAGNCLQAGMLATIAMLKGKGCDAFLEQQELIYRVFR